VRASRIGPVLRFLRAGRVRRDPAAAAVERFWRRWAQLRPAVAAALDSAANDPGELHAVEPQVAAAVSALHRRLGWSLAGGSGTAGSASDDRYVLVVTGEGDEELRALTDAWLAAAPADAEWDYQDAAPALDDPSEVMLGIGELQVALADVRVRALADGDMLHVALFHPALAQLDSEDRDAVSFVSLDTALGERLVERRIGCVEPVHAEPPDAIDLVALRELVRAMEFNADSKRAVCPTG